MNAILGNTQIKTIKQRIEASNRGRKKYIELTVKSYRPGKQSENRIKI